MDIETIAKLIAPVITAIVIFLIKRFLEYRPKLVTYLVHASAHPLNDEHGTIVNTHSIVVRNAGKKTANNVRIGHEDLPKSYQMYPQLTHDIVNGQNKSAEIVIPTLVPNEQVNISYLYFPPTSWREINSYCKSDEVNARNINIVPSPQMGKLFISIVWSLMFIGSSTVIYGALMALWWYLK